MVNMDICVVCTRPADWYWYTGLGLYRKKYCEEHMENKLPATREERSAADTSRAKPITNGETATIETLEELREYKNEIRAERTDD